MRSRAWGAGGPGMRRGQNDKAEAWAVLRVNTVLVENLKWHSGNNPLPDFGVDVLTEIVAADDLVTGRLIGIQVKGGGSWFKSPRATWAGFSPRTMTISRTGSGTRSRSSSCWSTSSGRRSGRRSRPRRSPRGRHASPSSCPAPSGSTGPRWSPCWRWPGSAAEPWGRCASITRPCRRLRCARCAGPRALITWRRPGLPSGWRAAGIIRTSRSARWSRRSRPGSPAARRRRTCGSRRAPTPSSTAHRGAAGSAFAQAAQAEGPQAALASAAAGLALLFCRPRRSARAPAAGTERRPGHARRDRPEPRWMSPRAS